MKWCPQCNGYGSSLNEASGRCTHCGGSGLVWADRERPSRTATASPPSVASERSRLVVDREAVVLWGARGPRIHDLPSLVSRGACVSQGQPFRSVRDVVVAAVR
jgi:hypothetical protein